MMLRCYIHHAAAISLDHSPARDDKVDIDVDLTALGELERMVVDSLLVDCRDISEKGWLPDICHPYRLVLRRPDAVGFREALAELVATWQSELAQMRAYADAQIREFLGEVANKTMRVHIAIDESGQLEVGQGQQPTKFQFCTALVTLPYRIPSSRYLNCPVDVSPDVESELRAMIRRREGAYQEALQRAVADLSAEYTTKIAGR